MSSICSIVRNEEDNIRRMIDNCIPYMKDSWELVIVDGGSTDNTIKIIEEEYLTKHDNIKLYHQKQKFDKREWKKEADLRNDAWLKCENDWVLSLDADEAYSPEFYQNLEHIIELNKHTLAFYFPTVNFIKSTKKIIDLRFWPDYHIRLAHRGHFIWVGAVHASLWYQGTMPITPNHRVAKALDYFLYHYARVKENLVRDYGEIPGQLIPFNGYHPLEEFDG